MNELIINGNTLSRGDMTINFVIAANFNECDTHLVHMMKDAILQLQGELVATKQEISACQAKLDAVRDVVGFVDVSGVLVKRLHKETGRGIRVCRDTLRFVGCDVEAARELLR